MRVPQTVTPARQALRTFFIERQVFLMSTPLDLNLPHLFLASQSPRRRQLLDALGIAYTAIASDAPEEEPDASNVSEVTVANAFAKAEAILDRVTQDEDVVVAADTLVLFEGRVCSKPRDRSEVIETLRSFSGKRHLVVTGMALKSRRFGQVGCPNYTWIQFRTLSDREIEDYADTREPYDKAGMPAPSARWRSAIRFSWARRTTRACSIASSFCSTAASSTARSIRT